MKERQENLAGLYPRQRVVTVHTGEQYLWWSERDKLGEVWILTVDVGSVMGARKRDAGEHFLYRLLLNELCAPSTEYPKASPLVDAKQRLKEFAPIKPQAPAPQLEKHAPLSLPSKPLTQAEFGM